MSSVSKLLRALPALAAIAVFPTCAVAQAPDFTKPPASDGVVTNMVPETGTGPNAPLTLPSKGRPWGVNTSTCFYTTHPSAAVRADRSVNRGVSCADERSRLAGIGVNAVRMQLSWYNLEYERDVMSEPDWVHLKATIDALGVPVVAMIHCTPWWATAVSARRTRGSSTCNDAPLDSPEIDAQAQEFGAELMRRLGSRVLAVEVYNEPNYKRFWQPAPDAARYGRLFKAVSRGVHSVDPAETVLFGGGALNLSKDDANGLTIETFFKRAIAEGGARPRSADSAAGWDAVSVHSYPPQYSYRVEPATDRVSGYVAGTVREVRRGVRWADPVSKIWWTETGVSNSGYQVSVKDPTLKIGPGRDWQNPLFPALSACGALNGACNATLQTAVGNDAAAEALEDMVRYLYSLPDTGGVFVHELVDSGSGFSKSPAAEGMSDLLWDGRMGLLETPGGTGTTKVKKAYCRLQSIAKRPLDPACPALSRTSGAAE